MAGAAHAAVRTATDVPYAIFGHSMGALVAFELASALEHDGGRPPEALFVSGRRPPDETDAAAPVHALPDAEFLDELQRRYGAVPDAVRHEPELLALLLPGLRADVRALETYRIADDTRIACPVHVYGGREDTRPPPDQLEGWSRRTEQPVRVRLFPGGHFFVAEEPARDLRRHRRAVGRSSAGGRSDMSAPVAIVGMACRFPGGADDPDAFWQLLADGRDAIATIDRRRSGPGALLRSRPADARPHGHTLGRPAPRRLEQFDAAFFGISPREARAVGPEQRLLLETTWEACEDATHRPHSLAGQAVGVFVGQWLSDFESRLFADPDQLDFYATTGSGRYATSGRVSYAFGLRRPQPHGRHRLLVVARGRAPRLPEPARRRVVPRASPPAST